MSSSCTVSKPTKSLYEGVNDETFSKTRETREDHLPMRTALIHRKGKERGVSHGLYDESAPGSAANPYTEILEDTAPLADFYDGIGADIAYSDVIETLFDIICASDTAASFTELVSDAGWQIGFTDLAEADFYLDVPQQVILLNNFGLKPNKLRTSDYFMNCSVVNFIQALRDILQENRAGAFEEQFNLDGILTLERVRAADLDVMTILVAWELRLAGCGDLWRFMIGSECGDMVQSFLRVMETDRFGCPVHLAMKNCFQQWFRDEDRVNECDHETLQYIDAAVSDGLTLPEHKAEAIDVEALTCLPDRSAYMNGAGQEVLRSSLYSGLLCEINQTHYVQLERESRLTVINNVAFQDSALASKIFPSEFTGICY